MSNKIRNKKYKSITWNSHTYLGTTLKIKKQKIIFEQNHAQNRLREEKKGGIFLISSCFYFFFSIFTFDFYSIDFSFITAFFIIFVLLTSHEFVFISLYFLIWNKLYLDVGSENLRLKFIVLLNAINADLKAFDHVFVMKLKVYCFNVVVTLKIYSIFCMFKCLIFLNNEFFLGSFTSDVFWDISSKNDIFVLN